MCYSCEKDIVENLKATGCSEEEIADFLQEFCCGNKNIGKKMLQKHRSTLVEQMHKEQKKIDCLDYFLYMMQQDKIKIES